MRDFKVQLRQFIEDTFILGSSGRPFSDADSFMEEHIIDSTGFLEVIMYIEETWDVTVTDDEVIPENLDSLDHLQDYLTRKLGA